MDVNSHMFLRGLDCSAKKCGFFWKGMAPMSPSISLLQSFMQSPYCKSEWKVIFRLLCIYVRGENAAFMVCFVISDVPKDS